MRGRRRGRAGVARGADRGGYPQPAAGEALGVGVLDHLVVGSSGRWVSLRDRGVFR